RQDPGRLSAQEVQGAAAQGLPQHRRGPGRGRDRFGRPGGGGRPGGEGAGGPPRGGGPRRENGTLPRPRNGAQLSLHEPVMRERGRIRLVEQGGLAAVALDGGGSPNGSMGVDAGDPFGIGRPSLWVTNYENELHALYRNECTKDRPFFLFATPATGIAAIGQKF